MERSSIQIGRVIIGYESDSKVGERHERQKVDITQQYLLALRTPYPASVRGVSNEEREQRLTNFKNVDSEFLRIRCSETLKREGGIFYKGKTIVRVPSLPVSIRAAATAFRSSER